MVVKICGITRPEEGQVALQAGADALGFVFEPRSPRHLPRFPNWQSWVPALDTTRVLVLADWTHLPQEWHLFHRVQWTVPLEVLQTGCVPDSFPCALSLWLAVRFPPEWSAEQALSALQPWITVAERFVLDAYHPHLPGGTGETHDWARARWLCENLPVPTLLAGGLNPENVAEAIRTVRPAGVDVSSGVEASPGVKDAEKIRLFIQRARGAL